MDVENFDIVKAPHSDKLRPTSFSLMTRKWYTERFANNVFYLMRCDRYSRDRRRCIR
jgi:hypothetical protein